MIKIIDKDQDWMWVVHISHRTNLFISHSNNLFPTKSTNSTGTTKASSLLLNFDIDSLSVSTNNNKRCATLAQSLGVQFLSPSLVLL